MSIKKNNVSEKFGMHRKDSCFMLLLLSLLALDVVFLVFLGKMSLNPRLTCKLCSMTQAIKVWINFRFERMKVSVSLVGSFTCFGPPLPVSASEVVVVLPKVYPPLFSSPTLLRESVMEKPFGSQHRLKRNIFPSFPVYDNDFD